MNQEVILNKYIDLIDKGYCCDCNELNCIDNFPHAKITHAIRELQQQNQKYKEVIDKSIECINKYESIKAYYEYIDEDGYDEYNYDEDFKKELLDILKEAENIEL